MEAIPRLVLVLTGALLICSGCVEEEFETETLDSNGKGACAAAEDLRSYYSPSVGTLNLHYGVVPCEAVEMIGSFSEKAYVVLNDVGRYISRINGDGTTAWTYANDINTYVIDLRVVDGDLQFIELNDVVTMDAMTGAEKSRQYIGYALCYDGEIQCLDDGVLILSTQEKIPALYPRAAVVSNGVVYVADTFGHKIIAYDKASHTTLWTSKSYFPNYIQVDSDQLVVTEEHANRIVNIDLTTQVRSIITACEYDTFLNVNTAAQEIQAFERSGALTQPDGRSGCSGQLYSPNHAAIQEDGSLLISDTDNHRVLHLDATGNLLREIRNFNNPVRTFLVP